MVTAPSGASALGDDLEFSNHAGLLIYAPFLDPIFGTSSLSPSQAAIVLPFPFVIWGSDELRRCIQRRRSET